MTTSRKPHISPSQMEMYPRCGEQYRRRYPEGEIIPPNVPLLIGGGYHAGAQINFEQKIYSHEDLPVAEIVDAAVAGFEGRVMADGFLLTDEESGKNPKNVLGEAKDQLSQLAEVHAKKQAPDYQPIAIEHRWRIVLPDATHDLVGVTDLCDDQQRVIDLKTAAKRESEKWPTKADTSVQLTSYAAAYALANHGDFPSEVRLDVLTKTKTPARQVLSSTRSAADLVPLVKRINTMLTGIQRGIFMPASPGDWVCSPRWCGYWPTCPYVNSERRAAVDRSE